jgi:NAD(P)-dependent dehydrogenase (short-subunit alcohol dehydrogenase family)
VYRADGVLIRDALPREDTEVAGRLAGKACVITGTGGSMGRAAALRFAREGASVVGCDVIAEPAAATVEMVHAAGGQMVSLHPSRISDPAERAKLVELAMSEFGRIDVLYNLAARSHLHWFEGFTDEELGCRPPGRGRPGLLPHPCGVAPAEGTPRAM